MDGFVRGNRYPNFSDIVVYIGDFVVLFLVVSTILKEASLVGPDIIGAAQYTLSFTLVLVFAFLYRFLRQRKEVQPIFFGASFKAPRPLFMLWGLLLVVAVSVVLEPLMRLMPEGMQSMYSALSGMSTIMVLTSIILAPIVEELFFRGIIAGDINKRRGPRLAILVSAIAFAIAHLAILPQAISAFVMGLVLGYLFVKSGSLWVVIFVHFINNLVAQLLFLLSPSYEAYSKPLKEVISVGWLYDAIYLGCLVLVVVVMVQILLLKTKKQAINVGDTILFVDEKSADSSKPKPETKKEEEIEIENEQAEENDGLTPNDEAESEPNEAVISQKSAPQYKKGDPVDTHF